MSIWRKGQAERDFEFINEAVLQWGSGWVIIYGRNLYGKVEPLYYQDGKEMLYIVTSFYHLYWFPLIPINSLLVVAGSESSDGVKGVDIGLSGRSIIAAYARVFALFYIFGICGLGAMVVTEGFSALRNLDALNWIMVVFGSTVLIPAIGFYSPTPGYTEKLAVKHGLLQRFVETDRGLVTAESEALPPRYPIGPDGANAGGLYQNRSPFQAGGLSQERSPFNAAGPSQERSPFNAAGLSQERAPFNASGPSQERAPFNASSLSQNRPPTNSLASVASTIASFAIALLLMGGLWHLSAGWREKMLAKPVPSPTPAGPARSVEWLADAKAASAKGDHLTATAKSQLALTALKQEGRPKKEVLACKELVARSAYKDKNYKVALEHYTGLQKVQPKPAHKKIIGVIRQEAWASQVKPLLAEADQHFANGDYAKARRPAQAARQTAKEFGLDLGPSNRILARVDAAEGAADARSTARRREAYLNEVIEVRVGGAYYDPYGGRLTRMKRREYLRRKAAGE